jgi:hypothetical protein
MRKELLDIYEQVEKTKEDDIKEWLTLEEMVRQYIDDYYYTKADVEYERRITS